MLIKRHSVTHQIPSGSFKEDDLKKLVGLATTLHEDCRSQVQHELLSKQYSLPNVDPNNAQSVSEVVDGKFHVIIEIFGRDGEYLNVLNLNEISQADLPNRISKLRITNHVIYEFWFKDKPPVYFEVVIDFAEKKIFDLISPSKNLNDSKVFVAGQNATVVRGLYSSFEIFFKNYSTYNGALHRQNSYDIFLWLFFFPLMLYILVKYQTLVPTSIRETPTVIQVLLGIVTFAVFALLCRLIYNLSAWFFPYMELTTQTSRARNILKYSYSAAVTTILGTLFWQLSAFIYEILTK